MTTCDYGVSSHGRAVELRVHGVSRCSANLRQVTRALHSPLAEIKAWYERRQGLLILPCKLCREPCRMVGASLQADS